MIKPEAMAAGHAGKILDMVLSRGFRLVSLKYTQLSEQEAGRFYEVHKERPFYGELVSYMASGPVLAAILEKDNAVKDFRDLIGATDPAEAAEAHCESALPRARRRTRCMAATVMRTPPLKGPSSSPVASSTDLRPVPGLSPSGPGPPLSGPTSR